MKRTIIRSTGKYLPPRIVTNDDMTQWMETSDRKSTRLNSSHVAISYAVFCLKKSCTEGIYACQLGSGENHINL